MNTPPDLSDADRALIERYRRVSDADGTAPATAVRAAILAEGRRAAATHADRSDQPATRRRWLAAALGGIAATLIGVLLVVPQWRSSPPPVAMTATATDTVSNAPASVPELTAAAPPAAAPPAAAPPAAAPARRERTENALAKSSARSAEPESPAAGMMADALAIATPETRDELGRTPLMLAAMQGNADLVRQLLAQGADPNAADRAGRTPLSIALARDDRALAALLRRAGAH